MTKKAFGRVAVLFGGSSGERPVSLNSGRRVLDALLRQGFDAHPFDPAERSLDELRAFDRAFIALHGCYGEDGTIQGALELLGIPYTGSGVMASALGMDKWRTKLLWRAAGLPVPDFLLLDPRSDWDMVVRTLGLPLFVKPACEGSSLGISKVATMDELPEAFSKAVQLDPIVLAERAVLGGEYTIGIVGSGDEARALPIVRIVPGTEFYDYEAKYLRDDTEYRIPSGLSQQQEKVIADQAIEAYRVLGCRGWGRVDFLMDEKGNHWFLEVNTAPGMTDHSLLPMAAKAAGMSYEELVVFVLESASLGV